MKAEVAPVQEGEAHSKTKGWDLAQSKWRQLQNPEGQDKWKIVTTSVLEDARALAKAMQKRLKEQDALVGAPPISPTLAALLPPGKRTPTVPAKSINVGPSATSAAHKNIERLRNCETSLLHMMDKAKVVFMHAQHAQRAKFAAMKLCEYRLEIRSRRPAKENFRDHLQEALEKERDTLQAARQQIGDLATEIGAMLDELNTLRAKVSRRLNESISPATGTASPTVDGGAPPETQEALLQRAAQKHMVCGQLLQKAEVAIPKSDRECADANGKVVASMNRRAAEVKDVRTKLEDQLSEVSGAIVSAESSLFRTRARFGESIDALDNAAKGQIQGTEQLLDKLKASKAALEEDLRCKIAASKIDDQCRRMAAHTTPSHKSGVSGPDFQKMMLNLSSSEPNLTSPSGGRRPGTSPEGASPRSAVASPLGALAPGKSRRPGTSPQGDSSPLTAAGLLTGALAPLPPAKSRPSAAAEASAAGK